MFFLLESSAGRVSPFGLGHSVGKFTLLWELSGMFPVQKISKFFGGDMSIELLGEMKRSSVLRMERSSRARRRRKVLRNVKNDVIERRLSKMRQLRQKYKKIRARHHD